MFDFLRSQNLLEGKKKVFHALDRISGEFLAFLKQKIGFLGQNRVKIPYLWDQKPGFLIP